MRRKNYQKILFITHESSLSGAPILLLNLLKLLKSQTNYKLIVIIKRGGLLDEEFSKIANTIILKKFNYHLERSFFNKVINFIGYKNNLLKVLREASSSHFIFSNTITNGRLLKSLSFLRIPIITYIHELEEVIKIFNLHGDSKLSLELSNKFLTPSSAVSNNLIKNHQLNSHDILRLNYFFPKMELSNSALSIAEKKSFFFSKYNISHEKFIVTGMGSATFRKGIDIFIKACKIVKEEDVDMTFVWIGDFIEEDFKTLILKEIEQYDLRGKLIITGFIPHSPENLLFTDLFVLPSREDPYPLVVLEAAFLGIPSISFENTGGITDFAANGAGFIIKEISAELLAQKIIYLKNNKDKINLAGKIAKEKVYKLHSDHDLIINQFESALNASLN